jgi:hypothetical protein
MMFNLGYLPGGDHQLVTRAERTVLALQNACELLADGGVLSVLAYRGHPGGREEAQAVRDWCGGQPAESWRILACPVEDEKNGPALFLIQRR